MAWTGTVLSCTTFDDRGFALTFHADGDAWTAADPHGLLQVEAGNFVNKFSPAALPATGCFFDNREYVLVLANVAQVAKGDEGAGSIVGGPDFSWTCTSVVA